MKDIIVTPYDVSCYDDKEYEKQYENDFENIEIYLENGYILKFTNDYDYMQIETQKWKI